MKQEEYLRRNLLVANAAGIIANAKAGKARLLATSNHPKWLIKLLDGIIERANPLPKNLAMFRDMKD